MRKKKEISERERERRRQQSENAQQPSGRPQVVNDRYLNSRQVRDRYNGISQMALWRWIHDRGFPKPSMYVGKRRWWLESVVVAWERQRAAEAR